MTVSGGTLCNLIQSFPVFLILAQNAHKCLKTPFVYKPPSPTHSPEYYEAYDALIQSLFSAGCNHHYHHDYQPYGYGKKWSDDYSSIAKPCYSEYPTLSTPGYPAHVYPIQGYDYHGSPSYVYKNANVLNTSSDPSNKYAKNYVNNIKHKYKVVVASRRGQRRSQKLQGFFPQREDRRFNAFGSVQNFLQNPRRTLETILHFGSVRENQNRPGIVNGPYYDQHGRPKYPNQYYNNNNNYPNRDYNNGKDVVFESGITNNPFQSNLNSNKDTDNHPNQEYITGRPNNEDTINIVENAGNQPNDGTKFEDNNNSIPNTPPANFNDRHDENSAPNNELGSINNIPDVPPPGFEDRNSGIPDVPPPGFEDRNNGIPNVPPPGFEDRNNGIPNSPPFTDTPLTALRPLTPVPPSEVKSNFNFGSQGLFSETCETVDGGEGSCITVFQCQPFLKLLQQSQNNPAAVQLLRRAHCGFDGSNPKVCCPRPGIPTNPPTVAPTEAPTKAPPTDAPLPSAKTLIDEDHVSGFPAPPVCGSSNASFTRVVGGVDAKLGDFPWMALLGYKGRGGQGTRWLCGGSLISSRHVLTAAHCIHGHEDDLYLVRLGELDLARDDEGATPVDVLIKTKVKHENYNPKAFTDDIAILVLSRDVKFTSLIRPICIPTDTELRARSYVDYNPIIAGWGDTEFRGPSATLLQALQLPVVSNEFCAQAYSQYKAQKIDERVLCAGYKDGGRDACQGDSGGPLMQPIWNSKKFTTHFYQIGVVSYGKKCAEAGFPGVYTRVTNFVPWLEEKMIGTV